MEHYDGPVWVMVTDSSHPYAVPALTRVDPGQHGWGYSRRWDGKKIRMCKDMGFNGCERDWAHYDGYPSPWEAIDQWRRTIEAKIQEHQAAISQLQRLRSRGINQTCP